MSQIHYLQLVLFAAAAAIIFGIFTTYKILNLDQGTKKWFKSQMQSKREQKHT